MECETFLSEVLVSEDSKPLKWNGGTSSDYLAKLTKLVSSLPSMDLSPDSIHCHNAQGDNIKCWIALHSDKFWKHITQPWAIPFGGGSTLSTHSIGSHIQGGMRNKHGRETSAPPVFNLAVGISPKFWAEKDYLNFRYLDKRNLLVLHLEKVLGRKSEQGWVGCVKLGYQFRDARRHCLVLTPPPPKKKGKEGTVRFQVRVVFGSDGSVFGPQRLLPDRNNVRTYWKENDASEGLELTPSYNASLALDAALLPLSTHLRTTFSNLTVNPPTLQTTHAQTVALLHIWGTQR